jgi:Fe-S cluster assembly scaffold protein SufB
MKTQNISQMQVSFTDCHIDHSLYDNPLINAREYTTMEDLQIAEEEKVNLKKVGVNLYDNSLSGKFLLYGQRIFTKLPQIEGVEILPLELAYEIYPEVKSDYYFKSIDSDTDEYTKAVYESGMNGYFIRVRKNVKVESPLHTAMFMHEEMSKMCIHNIVVLEEGAHLHLITGCTSSCSVKGGLHIAVSEQFVGKGAKLISTMVHNWGSDFVIRPRGGTLVEDDGTYVSNYYSVQPPKNIQSNPFTQLKGKNSNAKYMTILASFPETICDIGGTILMEGENSGAELVARAVNYGGNVIQTGLIIGAAKGSRAHVDCSGLMMSDKGLIEAIPGLRAMHPEARMSHEAAIGKIDIGEVNYLQSKGLDEMQAIALIIRGFLDIGIEVEGLDSELENTIQQIAELSGHGEE